MSNTPLFDRITSPQRIALISILSGDPLDKTAYLANVTDRTIRRWRCQPLFKAALADARRGFFSACRSHFNASLAVAFQTVVDSASFAAERSVRLKAALYLLDRVSHTEISAKPLPEAPQPIEINHLGQKPAGPKRTLAEISGSQRIIEAAERTLEDGRGPERPAIPTS